MSALGGKWTPRCYAPPVARLLQMRLVQAALFSAALFPVTALACSCLSAANLSPQQIAAVLQQYPYVVRASVISTEEPLQCRLAPVRWLYAAAGAGAQIRHTLKIRSTLRGPELGSAVVVQEHIVDFQACHTFGSAGCDPSFAPGQDVWALRRIRKGTLERAPMCTEGLVREVLRI